MPGKVNIKQALALKMDSNLSYQQIADIQGVVPTAIFKQIKKLLPDEATEVYKNNRADIIAHMQLGILQSVNKAKIKKASLRDSIVSFGILYDKERLERGQSTQILDAGQNIRDIEAMKKQTDIIIAGLLSFNR